ncbi:hypothetical protein L3X38_028744 [Prunus dulcis]|uniref:Uncharacterized protein n=1 Tax=Prunus dulcis TaxID=3755 RepID=A0AAD4Z0Q2_PRUDU|nr:hypothetical protein L3X38_028744 [Prunus dulcis]
MEEEEKGVLDYSSEPLMVDGNFHKSILSSIARARSAIKKLMMGVGKDLSMVVAATDPGCHIPYCLSKRSSIACSTNNTNTLGHSIEPVEIASRLSTSANLGR